MLVNFWRILKIFQNLLKSFEASQVLEVLDIKDIGQGLLDLTYKPLQIFSKASVSTYPMD